MAQTGTAQSAIGSWYLFMGDGICLKVSSDLYLGEDADGQLIINPKAPASLLLRVKKDQAGRLLIKNVSRRHVLDFEAGNATMVGEELSLLSGSKIVLPHNELYFNHEMQRGKVSARIALQAVADQTGPIEVLVEVVHATTRKARAAAAENHPIEPVIEEAPAQEIIVQEVVAETQVVPDVLPRQPAPYWKRFVAVGGLTIAAVLAAVWVAVTIDEEASVPQDQIVEEQIAPERVTLEKFVEVPVDLVPVVLVPVMDVPLTEAPLAEAELTNVITSPVVIDAEAVRQTAERLDRAKSYLEQGFITQPGESNAVRELSMILWADPANQEALNLMSEAANRLVDAAVEAQAAGLEFEARNLLEEVLGFHPEHQQANAYWRQWTGLDG